MLRRRRRRCARAVPDAPSTAAGSCTAHRPHSNAARLSAAASPSRRWPARCRSSDERQAAELERGTEQHDVGQHVVAEHAPRRSRFESTKATRSAPTRSRRSALGAPARSGAARVASAACAAVGVTSLSTTAIVRPGSTLPRCVGAGGLEDVARQVEVGAAGADRAADPTRRRVRRQVQVRHHRARLLRQAGLVHAADDEPGRLGGGGDDPVGGDDAGAADAGEVDAELCSIDRSGGSAELAGGERRRSSGRCGRGRPPSPRARPDPPTAALGVSVTNDGQSPSRHV